MASPMHKHLRPGPTSKIAHLAKFRGRSGPQHGVRRTRRQREDRLDAMLAASFPASDPPCWTLGRAG